MYSKLGRACCRRPLFLTESQRHFTACTLKKRQRCSQHFSGVHIVSCFVPLSMAVHIVYCFQAYSHTTGTTQYLFYNQQRVENCIVCHWLHTTGTKWICFVLLKLFLYQNQTHCTTNGFFQDCICVVWVCFVPLSMAVHIVYCFFVPVWICFVPLKLFLYETDPFVCFFVFVVYNLKHTVHFSQPKMSVLCAKPRMDLFRTIKTFFVPDWYKKSFNSTKPLRIL